MEVDMYRPSRKFRNCHTNRYCKKKRGTEVYALNQKRVVELGFVIFVVGPDTLKGFALSLKDKTRGRKLQIKI